MKKRSEPGTGKNLGHGRALPSDTTARGRSSDFVIRFPHGEDAFPVTPTFPGNMGVASTVL